MSDNDQQPETPQLTRRQLRELRNTASNPIIVDPATAPEAPTAEAEQPVVSAPLPRAAEPIEVPPAPLPDASVDLGAPALTRRQARLQEKIRTASIPVITPTGEHATHPDLDAAAATADEAPSETETEPDAADAAEHDADADVVVDESAPESVGEAGAESASDVSDDEAERHDEAEHQVEAEPDDEGDSEAADETEIEAAAHADVADDADAADADAAVEEMAADGGAEDVEEERHVVSEDLGADLLAGDAVATEVPASFDQLLSRSAAATGAFTTPNALILTQTPDGGPLVAPVTATGEVLITGTFALPENFGSTGVVPGVADGKEADAVLIDGELPASSSPTPIAASAAISTIKSAEDVIRPPAPEKGSRWTFALAITAGVLALALAGVLLVTLFTGVIG